MKRVALILVLAGLFYGLVMKLAIALVSVVLILLSSLSILELSRHIRLMRRQARI